MIHLSFTEDQMIEALIRAGYTVAKEREIAEERDYHRTIEKEVSVTNVYRHGEKMCVWAGYGTNRLNQCFEQELKKRLLQELF